MKPEKNHLLYTPLDCTGNVHIHHPRDIIHFLVTVLDKCRGEEPGTILKDEGSTAGSTDPSFLNIYTKRK